MSTSQIMMLVLAIVAFDALVLGLVFAWLRRRLALLAHAMRDHAIQLGERFVIEPQSALYRGGKGYFSKVKGNGVIALTDKRLLFRKAIGQGMEIPLDQIAEVSESKWFMGSYRGGGMHLVLRLRDGVEVGFMVRDHQAWMNALQSAIA